MKNSNPGPWNNVEKIEDIVDFLNEGQTLSKDEQEKCRIWLYEYQTANELSLRALAYQCMTEPDWVLDEVGVD